MPEFSLPRFPRLSPLIIILIFLSLVLALEAGYYLFSLNKKSLYDNSSEKSAFSNAIGKGDYVTISNLKQYVSPDENTYRGYIIPGRKFTIIEVQGDWSKISVWEEKVKMSWEGWIKTNDKAYQKE